MADRWRQWEEKQITGYNDAFLLQELEEKIEQWVFPRLKAITHDDNEFYKYGSIIWDNITILELEIRKANYIRKINNYQSETWWQRWMQYVCKKLTRFGK